MWAWTMQPDSRGGMGAKLGRRGFLSLAVGFAVAPLAWPVSSAAGATSQRYRVLRDGTAIGERLVEAEQSGADTALRIRTEIAVDVLGLTVYRYRMTVRETWSQGHLRHLRSRTDDNGSIHTVEAQAIGDRIRVQTQEAVLHVPPTVGTTCLWHPDTPRRDCLVGITDGALYAVSTRDRGDERIDVAGRSVPARHYTVSGDLRREVWYGPRGQLLRIRFPARDGSRITIELAQGGHVLARR